MATERQGHQSALRVLLGILKRSVVQSPETCKYRLICLPNEGSPDVHFQVIGKGIALKMPIAQLMRDNMLMDFNKHDAILITHLGTQAEHKTELTSFSRKLLRIVQQVFMGNQSRFVVQDTESEAVIEKSPSDLYFDPATKERYSAEDALLIGYSAAEERYKKIMDETITKPQYRLSAFADHQVHYLPVEGGAAQIADVEALFNDKALLAQFNPEEQSLLGYAAAESRYQRIMHEMHPAPVWVLLHTEVGEDNLWHCRSLVTDEEQVFSVEELFSILNC